MTNGPGPWRAVFETYPCDTCGAAPGQRCRTKAGAPYQGVHMNRTRHRPRCPRCSTALTADQEPGTYCAKCALLRTLEVERATKYLRRSS